VQAAICLNDKITKWKGGKPPDSSRLPHASNLSFRFQRPISWIENLRFGLDMAGFRPNAQQYQEQRHVHRQHLGTNICLCSTSEYLHLLIRRGDRVCNTENRDQTKPNEPLKTFWQMQTAQFRLATFFNTQQFCQHLANKVFHYARSSEKGRRAAGAWSGSTLLRWVLK